MPWFHGGKPGLQVGDEVLPPTVTGLDMGAKYGESPGATPDFAAVRMVALVGDMVEDLAELVAGLLAEKGRGAGDGGK